MHLWQFPCLFEFILLEPFICVTNALISIEVCIFTFCARKLKGLRTANSNLSLCITVFWFFFLIITMFKKGIKSMLNLTYCIVNSLGELINYIWANKKEQSTSHYYSLLLSLKFPINTYHMELIISITLMLLPIRYETNEQPKWRSQDDFSKPAWATLHLASLSPTAIFRKRPCVAQGISKLINLNCSWVVTILQIKVLVQSSRI